MLLSRSVAVVENEEIAGWTCPALPCSQLPLGTERALLCKRKREQGGNPVVGIECFQVAG
jgi:hypothetical protein